MTPHSEAEFAWPGGDRPGRLEFAHRVGETAERAIREALRPMLGAVMDAQARLTALQPSAGPAGRYRLTTPEGTWFVRVSARWGRPDLEQALGEFLTREGVAVNVPFVVGVPLPWEAAVYRIDVRPFIDGRHFDGSVADLRAIAALLARWHAALRAFPRRDEVQSEAARRNARLAGVRERLARSLSSGDLDGLCDARDWIGEHRDWLQRMAAVFDPRTERWPGAQCLHGEVHQGNVMFHADGSAELIDLEETVHVFAPPAWDLAFLVQRFCLADEPSAETLRERLAALASGYGAPLPPLAGTMQQAAWFAMAVIFDLRLTGGLATPFTEYRKFVALERQAAACAAVM